MGYNMNLIVIRTGKYRDGDETHLQNQERCMCTSDFAAAVDTIITATSNTTKLPPDNNITNQQIIPTDI